MKCPRCYTEALGEEEICRKCGYRITGYSRDYQNPYVFRDKEWNPYIGILHGIVIPEESEETKGSREENKSGESFIKPEKETGWKEELENSSEKSEEKTEEKQPDLYEEFYHFMAGDLTEPTEKIITNIKGEKNREKDNNETVQKKTEQDSEEKKSERKNLSNKEKEKSDAPKKKKGWFGRFLKLLLLTFIVYEIFYYFGLKSGNSFLPVLFQSGDSSSGRSAEEPEISLDESKDLLDESVFEEAAEIQYQILPLDSADMIQESARIEIASASASSELSGANKTYTAGYAFDNNTETSWQEGADGSGIGENISAVFSHSEKVKYISFFLGNWKSSGDGVSQKFTENNRPKLVTIAMDGLERQLQFPDEQWQYFLEISPACETSYIRLTIDDVYAGTKWNDTVIADISLYRE